MNTDETFIFPTFENRLTSRLLSHGIDMSPGDYLVRQARYMRRLAGFGFDVETLAATPAILDRHPQLLLGDECGPALVQIDVECAALPGE